MSYSNKARAIDVLVLLLLNWWCRRNHWLSHCISLCFMVDMHQSVPPPPVWKKIQMQSHISSSKKVWLHASNLCRSVRPRMNNPGKNIFVLQKKRTFLIPQKFNKTIYILFVHLTDSCPVLKFSNIAIFGNWKLLCIYACNWFLFLMECIY